MILTLLLIAALAVPGGIWAGRGDAPRSFQPVCLRHCDEDEEF